jgi:hypothetical protein
MESIWTLAGMTIAVAFLYQTMRHGGTGNHASSHDRIPSSPIGLALAGSFWVWIVIMQIGRASWMILFGLLWIGAALLAEVVVPYVLQWLRHRW